MKEWIIYLIFSIVVSLYLIGTLDFFFRIYHEEVTGEVLTPIFLKMIEG
jgi:hypothetical protein